MLIWVIWGTMPQCPNAPLMPQVRHCDAATGATVCRSVALMSQYTEGRGKPNPYIGRCTGRGNPLRLTDLVDNLFF